MTPALSGIETEYGLVVEGRGVSEQIEDSRRLVELCPRPAFVGWDYRSESPRADLRGFSVERLSEDPEDAVFDAGRARSPMSAERADCILTNGARFYNDHGHPEYSTPECRLLAELVRHDVAGQFLVLQAAQALARERNTEVKIYKNNSDFHGASFGTHESYLVPRAWGFDRLYAAVTPMLIARTVLCGAGKVGSEAHGPVRYQLSARADFFSERASVDTLYRRPVFNTRDEPHADKSVWARLHVIAGDANMNPGATRRKIGLVRLALRLLEADAVPVWQIPDPARSMMLVSRDLDGEGRIELEARNWTTPRQVLESYLDSAEEILTDSPEDGELREVVRESRELLEARHGNPDHFRRHVDWAAKRWLLEQYREDGNLSWDDPALRSVDLSYHDVDPETGLYFALVDAGEAESLPAIGNALEQVSEPTRARARGLAVARFAEQLKTASWGSLVFQRPDEDDLWEVLLPPDRRYDDALFGVDSLEEFLRALSQPS